MSRRRIREQNLNHVIEVVVIVSVIKKKKEEKWGKDHNDGAPEES